MQQVGSSTSTSFLLHHLSSSECGSETLEAPPPGGAGTGSGAVRNAITPPRPPEPQQLRRRSPTPRNQPAGRRRGMGPHAALHAALLMLLALGAACLACVCYWVARWRGGFAWDGTHQQFNWHPVLMVAGLVVVYGYGAVLYRVPLTWGRDKRPWKLLHAALMLLAMLLAAGGLRAVFGFHDADGVPHLYSLHSWVGIAATALFALQWVVGATAFLLPCSPPAFRALAKPAHVWLGGAIMTLSVVSCVSGINEKLFFALKGGANATAPYSGLPPEAVFANSLGAAVVTFGLLVLLMLSPRRWRRPEAAAGEAAYSPLRQEEE